MVEIHYCNLIDSPRTQTVSTMGSQAGPPGGDGWTQLARLPADRMPSGTSYYAFVVRGVIGRVQVFGSTPARGMVQLCLGTVGGSKHPDFRVAFPVGDVSAVDAGVPFQFVVLVHPSYADAMLGTSFNSGATELCLYGRTFWNGDAPTYAATFDVDNVQWLWFDIDHIPAGHWLADRVDHGSGLGVGATAPPAAFTRLAPTALGGPTQTWLVFPNVWYTTRDPSFTAPAPVFRFGVTPDGTFGSFAAKIGQGGRWGMRRHQGASLAGAQELPQLQLGGFFPFQTANGTTQVGYVVHESAAAVNRMLMRRWHLFAVRIDTLPDFRALSFGDALVAVGPGLATPEQHVGVIERPVPSPAYLVEPIVMVHGVANVANQRAGYGPRVFEVPHGDVVEDSGLLPQTDPFQQEGVSSTLFMRRVFQPTSPAIQWHWQLAGSSTAAAGPRLAYDLHFVAFHPVRDPNNVPDPPGTKPPPIVVEPGFQSANAAALNPPPFVPSAAMLAHGAPNRVTVEGLPYRRRWPLGGKPVAFYRMTWPALTVEQADTLRKFLRANPAWRFTPPDQSAIAVLNNSPIDVAPVGPRAPRLQVVSIEVAVCVFTGP